MSEAAGAEWWFYHVKHTSLEAAVGALLEKCLERQWRVVVAGRAETLDRLDQLLWTWRADSFLPHGRSGDGEDRQPIVLSENADAKNGAKVAMLLDGLEADADKFERCLVVFVDDDQTARGQARKQFKTAKDAGGIARYFQQTAGGGWEEWKP